MVLVFTKDCSCFQLTHSLSLSLTHTHHSRYAFYIVPGSSDSFSIGIHGGGWCYDEIDCLERSKNALGTSTLWNDSYCYGSPAFNCYGMENCTMVFLPYCDGSSFTSYREEVHPVPNSTENLHFRGRLNLIRTLDILLRDYGLGNAKDVVLAGGSAGGLSTYLGLDYVAERLPKANVVGMPVAGYFLDHAPAPFAGPIAPYQPPYVRVWDENCLYRHSGDPKPGPATPISVPRRVDSKQPLPSMLTCDLI